MQGEELKAVESVEITSKRPLRLLCCGGVSPVRCGFFHCQNEILWFLGKLRGVISVYFIVIHLTHHTFPVSFKIFLFVCECIYVQTRMKLQRNWARFPLALQLNSSGWRKATKAGLGVPCSRKKCGGSLKCYQLDYFPSTVVWIFSGIFVTEMIALKGSFWQGTF